MSIATLHIAFEPRGASEKDERVYNSSLLYTSRAILLLRMGRNDVLSDVLPFRLNPSESIASCKSHRSWEETATAAVAGSLYKHTDIHLGMRRHETKNFSCHMCDGLHHHGHHNLRKINPDYIPASAVRGCWKCISTKSSFYYYFPPPHRSP